jgi:hypothetical protein
MLARTWRIVCVLSLAAASVCARSEAFSFVALGDLPYGSAQQSYPVYRRLIASINQLRPVFSVHVGDIKSGGGLCSDAVFEAQRQHFDLFEQAVVYTPGDNEWTDCHRRSNGSYEPQERLRALRRLFFPADRSLGAAPLPMQTQPDLMPEHAAYVENRRWWHQGVLFVTVHIVGSNNNRQADIPGALDEFVARDTANIAWIRAAFEAARQRQAKALVLAMQGNPLLGRNLIEDFPASSGFRDSVGQTLIPLAAASGLPVLLIHGDTHRPRLDQPFRWQRGPLPQLYRLEVPGDADVRAWRVTVDTSKAAPFQAELIGPAHETR